MVFHYRVDTGIETHLADGMNEYGDEQAAMLRLNMAIVEERTCQWSLFQRALRDFDDKEDNEEGDRK